MSLLPLLCLTVSNVGVAPLEPIGVCNRAGACWDMAGHSDAKLTETVRASFSAIRWGSGTRCLLTRETAPLYGGLGFSNDVSTSSFEWPGSSVRIWAFGLPNTYEKKTILLHLSTGIADDRLDLPFSSRTNAKRGSLSFALGTPEPVPPQLLKSLRQEAETGRLFFSQGPVVRPTGIKMWRLPVSAESKDERSVGASFEALDKKGGVIKFVDRKGWPVSNDKTNAQPPHVSQDEIDLDAQSFLATFRPINGGSFAPVNWCVTNIAPGAIRTLRVLPWRWSELTLGPFPLNPNL